jgi:mono/diheme cytochrome c family protein
MKRLLKWLGYVVGVLIVLLVLGLGTVYAVTKTRMSKVYPTEVEAVAIPTDPASLERGKHLVEAVGKCQSCHGDNLGGKVFADSKAFMRLSAANLTAGKGGIGHVFTDADYVRAIRHGIGKDGRTLLFMPAEAYYYFNDADLGSIIAYLKTIPAVDGVVAPARSVGPIGRTVYMLTSMPLLSAPLVPQNQPRPAIVPQGVTKVYGEYLARSGGCTSCHGANLSGGNPVEGVKAANLTPGGEVGKWSEADFTKALRTGVNANGRILSAVMPYAYTKNMTDDEMRATWMYVHSVPAKQLGEK